MRVSTNRNQRFKRLVYSKKTYANPFFRRKKTPFIKPGGFLSNKIKLAVFAGLITTSILIWLLFFSTLFKINIIEISGVDQALAKDIDLAAWQVAENGLLGKNNLLLYNKNELIKIIKDKYYLQNLTVEKKLFHTLKVVIEEKHQAVVWLEDDKYFYLDNDGQVINQVDPLNLDGTLWPLIENLTGIKIEERQANINRVTIDYLLELFNEFKDKKHGFSAERFILDRDQNTIKMVILDGPKIYFNTAESAAIQAARLDLIIKEKLKDDFKTREYINLRFGNNIYIK
jgi:hypothetical protein